MHDEPIFREKAREAIRSGKLPTSKPHRTYGGTGSGVDCPVCGEPVNRDQMELEIEFARHGSTPAVASTAPGFDRYHLHLRCFAAWELERTKGLLDEVREP